MFEDSLFDSGAGKPSRKAWPKLASFTIEVCAIGVLVLLPLIYTQALPKQLWTIVETPSPLPGHAPARVVDNQPQRPRPAETNWILPCASPGRFRGAFLPNGMSRRMKCRRASVILYREARAKECEIL